MPDEPMDRTKHQPEDGVSRRSMIKRIGAATAVAWATPVITSLQTPAFAQTESRATCDCRSICGEGGDCPASGCFCFSTTENETFCSQNFQCGSTPTCSSSQDCPPGWRCQGGECPGSCGAGVCVPPCGTCQDDLPNPVAPRMAAGARTNG